MIMIAEDTEPADKDHLDFGHPPQIERQVEMLTHTNWLHSLSSTTVSSGGPKIGVFTLKITLGSFVLFINYFYI